MHVWNVMCKRGCYSNYICDNQVGFFLILLSLLWSHVHEALDVEEVVFHVSRWTKWSTLTQGSSISGHIEDN